MLLTKKNGDETRLTRYDDNNFSETKVQKKMDCSTNIAKQSNSLNSLSKTNSLQNIY